MRKLLHIIDDPKFINMCKETFDIDNVENYYLKSGLVTVEFLLQNKIDVLFIHFLREPEINFLNSHDLPIPVVWFFWGADGFRLGKFYNKFLLPKTKKLKLKLAFSSGFVNGLAEIQKRLMPFTIDATPFYKAAIAALDKIDFIVPIVPGDYYLLKKGYKVSARMFHLNYVVPVFDQEYKILDQPNILLGNSADLSNNHVEIIDRLAKSDLGNRKVYIPLSYGNRKYAHYIKKYAEQKLSDHAICLMDFLDFNSYQDIVQTCGIVLLAHLRQQALGNIVQSLMVGSRIYLHPDSTVFQYLSENDFYFSSILNITSLSVLDKTEVAHNRSKCRDLFGKERQKSRLQELLNALSDYV